MPDLAAPSAVGIPNPRIVVALSGSELEPCLSALSNGRIGLEIQDFAYPGVLDGDWREVVATYRRLRANWTGPVSLHGPIYDLNPASLEPQLVELTRRRYGLVLEIAAELQAERVVLHTQFNPCLRHPSYPTRWIAQNAAFWRQLLADPLGPIVVLENMWDVCPDHLADLIDEVDCPRLRACLDTGHARLFSHVPLRGWVGRLGERIDYVHLTDNHGGWDEHLAIGAGSIDFEPFFAELIARGINPIFVPEVGTNDEVLRSLKALGWDSALSREDQVISGQGGALPKWAPRVPPGLIRRLYQLDAMGIVDEELIDRVAFAIRARCESILTATEASRGRVRCPACDEVVIRQRAEGEVLECRRCGWRTSWERYFSTYRRRQLHAGAGEPIFREYLDRFASADTPRKRMLLVDWVVHQCHQSLQQKARGLYGRPIAVNLIDARIREVVDLVDELAYGQGSAPESLELRERWRESVLSAHGGHAKWASAARRETS